MSTLDNSLYTDNVRLSTPRIRRPSDSERMEERCRMFNPQPDGDILYDAADHIREQRQELARVTSERDAADARVKVLEAEHAAMRADRDRLATKVQNIARLTDPQVWAENSRNRTQLMAELFDAPAPKEAA